MSDVHEAVASLARDLRQWLDWARATGAEALPPAPPDAVRRGLGASPAAGATAVQRAPQRRRGPDPRAVPAAANAPSGPLAGAGRAGARGQAPPTGAALETLEDIRRDVGECRRCRLCEKRRNIVFGVGSATADLLIAGEGPGRNEDLTGEPFVGRAGRLLNRMLAAIGLGREAVYICNVVKCRPPDNWDPRPDEVATCSPFLHRQVRAVSPRVIMAVGGFAGRTISGLDANVGSLRRETRSFLGIPVVVTYHPAYLLRSPAMKRRAWDDLLRVRALLRGQGQR